jgi:eukaryotic-like serine/threonine-protein kinase
VHQVGAGVLGPVFRGYDPEQDRAVAIKAFALDLTPEQAHDVAEDLGRLPTLSLKHPSIITPFAAGSEGSTAYLVQEYFVAESADVALKQYGPAPVPDAMRLIGQLAGALDFAAAAGIHHGALHPRDILVAPQEVRLSGLGVVEALERVGYRAPVRRPYAAPERAAGGGFGSPADVFSIAGVSY